VNCEYIIVFLGWLLLNMFSVLQYGYAIIDLENLDPLNVDDLSLSQYLAYILQVCITDIGYFICW
jgi:hypothetical protein